MRSNTLQQNPTHCNTAATRTYVKPESSLKRARACHVLRHGTCLFDLYVCALQCVAVCSVLQCVNMACHVLQHGTCLFDLYMSVLQCVALHFGVLQWIAVCYNVLQCIAVCGSVLQYVVVCCSALQCVAVCCSVLQCVVAQRLLV